jgi:hypothetical protein
MGHWMGLKVKRIRSILLWLAITLRTPIGTSYRHQLFNLLAATCRPQE